VVVHIATDSLGITPGFVVGMILFGVALLILVVIVVRWAVRQDRAGRRAWQAARQADPDAAAGDVASDEEGPGAAHQGRGRG
jgi:hypothetical protein